MKGAACGAPFAHEVRLQAAGFRRLRARLGCGILEVRLQAARLLPLRIARALLHLRFLDGMRMPLGAAY